jgi:UDP-N-acetylmuramoyl-L-alanyl-D-glutamate--2,6-diaminopimelate ligase
VPVRAVAGLRELAGAIAAEFHGRPSERMHVVAVTGTNGKTSTAQWVSGGAVAMGRKAAVVGTLGSGIVGAPLTAGLTTPDAPALQSLLAGFASQGVELVCAEASSIGLDQGRLNGTRIEVAAFTNLTRDHLDYHGTLDAYAAAKARLFAWPGLRAAVVNGDDPHCVEMLAALSTGADGSAARRIVYGLQPGQHGARGDAVLIGERVIDSGSGLMFSVSGDFGRADVTLPMIGAFNASNALAVLGCWLALGHEFDVAVRALEALAPVAGRMQRIEREGQPLVVVDYAHTPDALANVLGALRPVALGRGGRLWCVFGAGGDRDPGKRPMMGLVAERGADALVITSDNPRAESPFRIVSDIRAGLTREPAVTELERAKAIRRAVFDAAPADVVLIAGKGHETGQVVAGVRLPFSDVEVAGAALAARAGTGNVQAA